MAKNPNDFYLKDITLMNSSFKGKFIKDAFLKY